MDEKARKTMGNNLKQARERLNLTQAEVAGKANINSNFYARIERGEEQLSLDSLYFLCKALKLKSSDILPF